MLIDWFTVLAQAINFFVLVWLLKRFLYTPILRAIDTREERIAARLADVERKMAEARAERDEYRRRNAAFDQEREEKLRNAEDAAQRERQRLMEQTRTAAEQARLTWRNALRNEARQLQETLRRHTQREVFAIARRALSDLSGESLEQRLVSVFITRLRNLDSAQKNDLSAALHHSGQALVRSAFALNTSQQNTLRDAIAVCFQLTPQLRFEVAPELVDGIALSAGGHEVTWSIAEYLDAMQRSVENTLRAAAPPGPDTPIPPQDQRSE